MHNTDLHTRALTGSLADRLIYADHLEEQGNDLGTLIRLACDIKQNEDFLAQHAGKLLAATETMGIWFVGGQKEKFAELRTAVLSPIVRAIDEAWPKCTWCDGNGFRRVKTNSEDTFHCHECRGYGRKGKLWRDCPECRHRADKAHELSMSLVGRETRKESIEYIGQCRKLERDSKRCTRCSGFGVLLECVCSWCEGGGTFTTDGLHEDHVEICDNCKDGYIRSPLADLADTLDLIWDSRAEQVRRGDAGVVLSFLNSEK